MLNFKVQFRFMRFIEDKLNWVSSAKQMVSFLNDNIRYSWNRQMHLLIVTQLAERSLPRPQPRVVAVSSNFFLNIYFYWKDKNGLYLTTSYPISHIYMVYMVYKVYHVSCSCFVYVSSYYIVCESIVPPLRVRIPIIRSINWSKCSIWRLAAKNIWTLFN